jgi:hypothetical protein
MSGGKLDPSEDDLDAEPVVDGELEDEDLDDDELEDDDEFDELDEELIDLDDEYDEALNDEDRPHPGHRFDD